MCLWILAFLCGILCLQQFSFLPNLKYILILLTITLFLSYFKKKMPFLRLIVAFFCGFIWVSLFAHWQLSENIPAAIEGTTVSAQGYIASIPNENEFGVGFLFYLENLNAHPARGLVKLTWSNKNIKLHAGDEWQLNVRLKKPYGTMNPSGFDYEAYALESGIHGNGSVVGKSDNQIISSHWYHYTIDRIRQTIAKKISQQLPQSKTSHWITALTIGERKNIPSDDWGVLRNTGTNHLMAIAGLHIGFMALLAHVVVSFLWCRFPKLTLKIPASHAGALGSLIIAFIYSAMAGFSIPTQRACLMIFTFIISLLLRRHLLAWQTWSVALLFILLFNPLSVLTESFWLSFCSVALIIYGVSGRVAPRGLWWKWGRIQWVIAIGLLPFSLWLFQQFSFISFVANSIAIPWVGCVIVPLCFLGVILLFFSPMIGGIVLHLADQILSLLWIILNWLAHIPSAVMYQHTPVWMMFSGILGVLLLLLPIGFPGRYYGFFYLLPFLFYKAPLPKSDQVWFTLLDVGQGLAAVVQTQHHTLLFDAGPKSGSNFDMGESVVLPFLRGSGIKNLDAIVISHGDNDHIGGLKAVTNHIPTLSLFTSIPELIPESKLCLKGTSWNWDGVNFSFLYPTNDTLGLNNDSSCVLRIGVGKNHILLTGDIEEFAEEDLLQNTDNTLQSEILIAPHHGSKTSGLKAFIENVDPHYVLYPIGYRNRYHFPHASVIKTYDEILAKQLDSVKSGAIQFSISKNEIALPNQYRLEHKHYWNN